MDDSPLADVVIDGSAHIVLLVLDGVGDLPDPARGGRTPLEAARTPTLDALAPRAALGRLLQVAPGITPGSGPGHLALFGYDPVRTVVGRGVLEALGAGLELRPGDIAARGNFCTVRADGVVTDRRAGRIAGERCAELIARLARDAGRVEDVEIVLRAGRGHRFAAVLRGPGLGDGISDADPHREGVAVPPARAADDSGAKTARVANAWIATARELLADAAPANGVLLRGLSARPSLPGMKERFRLRAAALAAYPMYRGVAQLAGMEVVPAGETVAEAMAAAAARWDDFDFFFIHVKATDRAGEDGDFDAKVAAIEDFDRALPALLARRPEVVCVTGDHSTPVAVRGHSWHPVPLLVHGAWSGMDGEARFHERACRGGSLGQLFSRDLLAVLLANAGRLDKFGA